MSSSSSNNAPPIKTVHVRIEGRVQGVCFRYWTQQEAARRNLDGWVQNRADGSVEALFSGPEETVTDMLEACWTGPPSARVDNVTTDQAAAPAVAGFRVQATR